MLKLVTNPAGTIDPTATLCNILSPNTIRVKQSQNTAPSMDESEHIVWKVMMNDREMKLELASEAVG